MADLLLVDDDRDITEVLSEFLEDQGHRVRVAANGEEGLRLLDERIPDVALLDVEMPVLDGPRLAYRMFLADMGREKVPIVFLSGVADLEQVASRVGTRYCLTKPFTLDCLLKVLGQALRERIAPTYPRKHAASLDR